MTCKEELRNALVWFTGAVGLTVSNIYELTMMQTIFESLYGVVIVLGLIILTLLLMGFVKGNEDLMKHIENEIEENGADKYIYSKWQKAVEWFFTIVTCIIFAYFGYGFLLTGFVIVTIEALLVLNIIKDFAMVYKCQDELASGEKTLEELLDI